MKLLLAIDMEGVSGVVNWDQVTTTHPEYARFRKLLAGEINAAARGAYDAGAGEILVADGHANGQNLLVEELDPRLSFHAGASAPFSMVQGVESGVAGVMLVGYHARMGTPQAILDHTWSDERVANLRLNGRLCGEAGLNAALCGHFGAPVLLVTGDQAVCAEAQDWLGEVETAIVKHGQGRMSGESLPPQAACQAVYEAAYRAVGRLRYGQGPALLRLEPPIRMELEFVHSGLAERAAALPGASRSGAVPGGGSRVEYTAAGMPEIYQAFRAMLALAWQYQT